MSLSMNTQPRVPPGFRFHPTDEELVEYYLKKKVESKRIDLDVIREIDLYKLEPWDLQEKCKIGATEQDEWYFFSHKDKKYPTGTRTNRATAAGFWKATGRDKAIYTKLSLIGMRKTLVFYKGRAPNGVKTDWIMHEYRLETCENGCIQSSEEGWVVCRVFRKRCPNVRKSHERDSAYFCDDHLDFLPEIIGSPKNGNHVGDLFYNHSFACKQELEIDYHLVHDPFLQLPQLESPKVPCYGSTSNFKSLTGECSKRPDCQPSSFCIDRTNFEGKLTQLIAMPTMPLSANFSEEQQVTDWRVLDRFVASQLSQDDTPKEIRFPVEDSFGDVSQLLHQGKQQSQEYNQSNDVDLWSYAKRDMSTGLHH